MANHKSGCVCQECEQWNRIRDIATEIIAEMDGRTLTLFDLSSKAYEKQKAKLAGLKSAGDELAAAVRLAAEEGANWPNLFAAVSKWEEVTNNPR